MVSMTAVTGLGVGASIALPLVTGRVIDGPVRSGNTAGLLTLGLLALALGIAEAVFSFAHRWAESTVAADIEARMRGDLYEHLQRLPVSFHDQWQTGQLLSRATTDLGVIRRFFSFGLILLLVNGATFIVVVALLINMYWPLGLLVGAGAVPLFLISRKFEHHYIAVSRKVQDQQGDLSTFVEESAVGIRTIKSFGRQRHVAARFDETARALHDSGLHKARLIGKYWSAFDVIPNAMLATVLVVGAVAVARGDMTIGQLVAFVSLTLMLVWPVDSLGWLLAMAQESMTAADRIYEVLDTDPSIVDIEGAVTAASGKGHLVFHDVGFTYPGANDSVVHNVELDIAPGETMALVGITGSGKTTLTSLVTRLYDVTEGRITLDGQDIRELRLESLRTAVSVAFEDPTLFSASVRENLTLGRPDATEDEITEALRIAQAEFVHDLPWGLDTRIGEQGLSLSGGQRQRLALARAVIGRPRVLVLDDPLSALDVHTEALVEEALARVLTGTTALLVVHRPSTVALADRVAFLENGTITAVGTHSELMTTVPSYRAALSASTEEVSAR